MQGDGHRGGLGGAPYLGTSSRCRSSPPRRCPRRGSPACRCPRTCGSAAASRCRRSWSKGSSGSRDPTCCRLWGWGHRGMPVLARQVAPRGRGQTDGSQRRLPLAPRIKSPAGCEIMNRSFKFLSDETSIPDQPPSRLLWQPRRSNRLPPRLHPTDKTRMGSKDRMRTGSTLWPACAPA